MPITVGTGAGEYPPTVQFVTNGEPADDLTFNRPTQDVADRTSAIKTCLDAFPITEVVGLAAAHADTAPQQGVPFPFQLQHPQNRQVHCPGILLSVE